MAVDMGWTTLRTVRWAPVQSLCWSDTPYFLTLEWKGIFGWLFLESWQMSYWTPWFCARNLHHCPWALTFLGGSRFAAMRTQVTPVLASGSFPQALCLHLAGLLNKAPLLCDSEWVGRQVKCPYELRFG